MNKQLTQIKDCMEALYARYNRREFIGSDPLQFVYEYSNPEDMEIAAFLSAGLAYGRVQQIQKSLTNLFGRIGESLYAFVRNFDERKRAKLKDFKHRFTTGDDISDLLALLRDILNKFGSIEKFFIQNYNPGDRNIVPVLSKFCNSLLEMYAAEHNGITSRGLKYLLVNPANGSACKRLNLFLRWMIRDDDVDAGLWKSVDKAKLIVPVDVHMTRLCRIIGFHNQKTASLSTALKITKKFAEVEPKDPVKYDFALTRIGIVDECDGNYRPTCQSCELFGFCRK